MTRWLLKWRVVPDAEPEIAWAPYFTGRTFNPWSWSQREAKRFETKDAARVERCRWVSQNAKRWAERPRIVRIEVVEDYIFWGDGHRFLCLRCGDTYEITMPIDLELFGYFAKAYDKRHRKCRHRPMPRIEIPPSPFASAPTEPE